MDGSRPLHCSSAAPEVAAASLAKVCAAMLDAAERKAQDDNSGFFSVTSVWWSTVKTSEKRYL